MTDEEIRQEQRLEHLTKTHRVGPFEISFDPTTVSTIIKTGQFQVSVPISNLKQFASTLQNLDMTLFLLGIQQD